MKYSQIPHGNRPALSEVGITTHVARFTAEAIDFSRLPARQVAKNLMQALAWKRDGENDHWRDFQNVAS
jgi:hypothetical protein